MRASNTFLAIAFLASLALLLLFGASVLPKTAPTNANANASAITALTAPTVDYGNPQRGAEKPLVTIVSYGDYGCAACAAMAQDLDRVLAAHPTEVRLAWKDFPNAKEHADSPKAAEAGRCAALQGKFWEMNGLLFANPGTSGEANWELMAQQLGLDVDQFGQCMTGSVTEPQVQRDLEEGIRLQIDATPYLFIGKRRVSGAVGYDQVEGFVRAALAEARGAAK